MTDGALPGEFSTRNFGESPKDVVVSSLSRILQENAPEKYYLSRKACLGILRRAKSKGRDLPPKLKSALELQAGLISSSEDTLPAGDGTPLSRQMCESHNNDARYRGPEGVAPTVTSYYGTGGDNTPLVTGDGGPETYALQGSMIGRADRNGPAGGGVNRDVCFTLNTTDRHAVYSEPEVYGTMNYYGFDKGGATLRATGGTYDGGSENLVVRGSVRRLTPLECERLQGFPDGWTDIGRWTDGKGKLHARSADSARYKALGNSIALPPWEWVLRRLSEAYADRVPTMASLFDGIGGFPLLWERINGKGTCLWASEIEEFPIAVTKRRFGEE